MRLLPRRSVCFLSTLAIAGAALCAGCRGGPELRETRAWHGQTPIMASYQWGKLTADLPPGTDMSAVMGVTRALLYRQGHIIESYSVSPQGGTMVALSGGNAPYNRIRVDTAFEGSTVMLRIGVTPSDENRARVVLESILEELGM
ncbi:MAG: hypothetical protein KC996_10345 [Phycisphaerales bacterium]|nr:hypothetical protein [Phycisphaerales bacterium]